VSLTNAIEERALNWINGVDPGAVAPVRPTTPLNCRLMTANGDDAAAGTEVVGSAYTPKNANIGGAVVGTDTVASNTADIAWTSLDATTSRTIVGVEIWDSAATPVRVWHGALTASKVVNAADPFTIPAGSLDLALG
jgi:hypothetical protein